MNMEIIGPFLISSIAGLSTMLGSLFIFMKPKKIYNFIGTSLAFSATIMLLISITDLIPEAFIYLEHKYSVFYAILSLILMILCGYLINTFLNKKITKKGINNDNLYKVGILSLIALMIHNLPEGILTFLSSSINMKMGLKFGIAIMMHNIPEGIAIAVPIYYSTKSKSRAVRGVFLSAIAEPLGALIAYLFLYKYISNLMISILLMFIAGLMIAISINDIFMEANKYPKKNILIGVGIGIIIIILNQILFS
jgi:ZIP family zinc transporter